MIEVQEIANHNLSNLYRYHCDMAGLKEELQNKKALCGNCGTHFNQKFVRFDRYGVMICPSCVLAIKIGVKKEDVISIPLKRGD